MLKNWLQAPPPSSTEAFPLEPWMVGQHILPTAYTRRELAKVRLAIIGLDGTLAQKTRSALRSLAWPFGDLALMDLGDLRKSSPEFLTPLLREFSDGKIVPIIIGDSRDRFRAQYQAFQAVQSQVSVLMLDQRIRLKVEKSRVAPGYCLNPAVHNRRHKLYHLSHLGAQRHLVDPDLFDLFNREHFDSLRLGDIRQNLSLSEPILRDADLLGVDLSVLSGSVAPAQSDRSPAGLSVEEAARLCRYAGLSDKLRSFGIYGLDHTASEPEIEQTAAAAAQLIWYFCDGFANRYGDFPVSNRGLLEYIVDHPSYQNLTFWKSRRSGRWWVQSPSFNYRGEERHRLVACSQADYEAASRGELPERLMAAFLR